MINESYEKTINVLLRKLAKENRFVDDYIINIYSNEIEKNQDNPEKLHKLEYIFNELLTNQDNCNQVIQDILNVNDSTPEYLREPRIRVLSDNDVDIQEFINIKTNQNLLDSRK